MGELLIRRRDMVLAGSPLPAWDYEWTMADGLLSENDFTISKKGTGGTEAKVGNSYENMTGSSSNYNDYLYKDSSYLTGVIEADMYAPSSGNRLFLYFGNGSYGISVFFQGNSGIYINSSPTIKVADGPINTRLVVKAVLKRTTADVYVNGTLVSADVDVTTFTHVSIIKVSARASGSNGKTTRLHGLRMKFNRI